MTKVKDIVAKLNEAFPESIASAGDPVGLQIGSLEAPVHKILVTLDVRPNVVDEAIRRGANLIVSHHPLIFRPVNNLDYSDPQKAMYAKIIANGITVYSIHTNSDKAQDGSSDWQAEELGLLDVTGFAPDEDGIAIGRKGRLPEAMKAIGFAHYVKEKMGVDMVRLICADQDKMVETVAFVCGDGNKFWKQALADKCDAYITGDVYYHTGHDMISSGLVVVDPGHYTEKLFKYEAAKRLSAWQKEEGWSVECLISAESTDPFQNIFE